MHTFFLSYYLFIFSLKLPSFFDFVVVFCMKMKSYIWLQTADGSFQRVEEEVAMFCPMICREIIQAGMGSSKNHAISLPQRVNPAILGLILDYCRFHQVPGHSNKVLLSFVFHFLLLFFSSCNSFAFLDAIVS
jgi:S-phase kinase-associated protein 1